MQRTLAQLANECRMRGVLLEPGQKYQKRDYVKLLAEHSLWGMDIGYGLEKRLALESPMLCFSFRHLHDYQQEECLHGTSYLAEEKWNGVRMIVTYHPDEGFRFFSRHVSVEDYLPIEYTDKVLLITGPKDNLLIVQPSGYNIKLYPSARRIPDVPAFVVDTEVLVNESEIDTSILEGTKGTDIHSELNACTSILSLETSLSQNVQIQQASLHFKFFDILWLGEENLMENSLLFRKSKLLSLLGRLEQAGLPLPFENSPMELKDKQGLFDRLIKEGKEGIVLKEMSSPYIGTTSRKRDGWIKMKRSMFTSAGEELDLFVVGSTPSTKGKAWEDYIGGLEFATMIRRADGSEYLHVIASVTGLPMEMRKRMTTNLGYGPTLHSDWMNKVFVVNAQSITAKNKRFAHASIEWGNEPLRPDKTPDDCVMEEEFLLSQVM